MTTEISLQGGITTTRASAPGKVYSSVRAAAGDTLSAAVGRFTEAFDTPALRHRLPIRTGRLRRSVRVREMVGPGFNAVVDVRAVSYARHVRFAAPDGRRLRVADAVGIEARKALGRL